MPGPPAKPASQRRRQNKTTGRRTLPAAPPKRRVPGLGSRKPAWLKATREWWATIWRSPMSTTWIEADVPALKRLAVLVDLVGRGQVTAMLLSEMRQLEDRFGLSPLARRRLEWELEAGRDADIETASRKDQKPEGDGRWLRAVK
jgi:hypothetical protein